MYSELARLLTLPPLETLQPLSGAQPPGAAAKDDSQRPH
jgi:hypothetical protein